MKSNFSSLMDWMNHPKTLTPAIKISRLLAVILGIMAVLSLAVFLTFSWPMLTNGGGIFQLLALLDEMDDEIEAILLLFLGAVVFTAISCFLKQRNKTLTDTDSRTNDTATE